MSETDPLLAESAPATEIEERLLMSVADLIDPGVADDKTREDYDSQDEFIDACVDAAYTIHAARRILKAFTSTPFRRAIEDYAASKPEFEFGADEDA